MSALYVQILSGCITPRVVGPPDRNEDLTFLLCPTTWLRFVLRYIANWLHETQFLFQKPLETCEVYQFHLLCNRIFDFINYRRFYSWNSSGTKPFYLKLLTSAFCVFSHQHIIIYVQIAFTDMHLLIMSPNFCLTIFARYIVTSRSRLSSAELFSSTCTNCAVWILSIMVCLAGDRDGMEGNCPTRVQ